LHFGLVNRAKRPHANRIELACDLRNISIQMKKSDMASVGNADLTQATDKINNLSIYIERGKIVSAPQELDAYERDVTARIDAEVAKIRALGERVKARQQTPPPFSPPDIKQLISESQQFAQSISGFSECGAFLTQNGRPRVQQWLGEIANDLQVGISNFENMYYQAVGFRDEAFARTLRANAETNAIFQAGMEANRIAQDKVDMQRTLTQQGMPAGWAKAFSEWKWWPWR
jgi:hypothetical protein